MATGLGAMRHRVTIQRKADPVVRNSQGDEVPSWVDVAIVQADIEPLSARELLVLRAEVASISARIRIRYRPGITAAMRVVHGATIYRIDGTPIDEKLRHRELVLLCATEDLAS